MVTAITCGYLIAKVTGSVGWGILVGVLIVCFDDV